MLCGIVGSIRADQLGVRRLVFVRRGRLARVLGLILHSGLISMLGLIRRR